MRPDSSLRPAEVSALFGLRPESGLSRGFLREMAPFPYGEEETPREPGFRRSCGGPGRLDDGHFAEFEIFRPELPVLKKECAND